ncbi:Uma2 family endonuclease [Nitrosococcus wardiae]|uniref:Uma2 family endonuclease n=1 Tax=Nitrosococcus wardiae TaxID=1814290 RepID=A0A4P7BUD2_9GAMM|nr:Uma2 family endonuclease [Nitrosococcus wardiae]QBQ53533.1 Uma2 family endonuclease [Nitrosococcus wardiae]
MLARKRHPFTVQDYHRMAEVGILHEDDRVELLDGEILEMSPIGSRHAAAVDYLTAWLSREVGERAIVRVQSPIRLSLYSEPQPDLTLLKPRSDFYASAHPGPEDVLLLIEMAESSLDDDRDLKLPRYAEAGILESWIIDLPGQRLLVYREPVGRKYQSIQEYHCSGNIALRAFPWISLDLKTILELD